MLYSFTGKSIHRKEVLKVHSYNGHFKTNLINILKLESGQLLHHVCAVTCNLRETCFYPICYTPIHHKVPVMQITDTCFVNRYNTNIL